MILADKIQILRKNSGWSQEELAAKLNVSRQSVSKWESAAAIPDINRILDLAKVFGVSTDYLLRDDLEVDRIATTEEIDGPVKVALSEMNDFLDKKAQAAKQIAFGVMLCILSPSVLVLLAASNMVSEYLAIALGSVVLFSMIAIAVALFIMSGALTSRYRYLEKSNFELDYGLMGIVHEKKEIFHPTFARDLSIGIGLCIMSPALLFAARALGEHAPFAIWAVVFVLIFIASGVGLIVRTYIIKGGYDQLLREGDYTRAALENNRRVEKVASIYWPVMTAIYLAWSFITSDWHISWIIWPVAGALFGGVSGLMALTKSSSE